MDIYSQLYRRAIELDELYTKIQVVTGYSVEQLLEMFASGYTLDAPDSPATLTELFSNTGESEVKVYESEAKAKSYSENRCPNTQCQSCSNADHCHTRFIDVYLRGEDCQFWQLGVRFGVKCCASCLRYDGQDCKNSDRPKKPTGYCDEWEEDQ